MFVHLHSVTAVSTLLFFCGSILLSATEKTISLVPLLHPDVLVVAKVQLAISQIIQVTCFLVVCNRRRASFGHMSWFVLRLFVWCACLFTSWLPFRILLLQESEAAIHAIAWLALDRGRIQGRIATQYSDYMAVFFRVVVPLAWFWNNNVALASLFTSPMLSILCGSVLTLDGMTTMSPRPHHVVHAVPGGAAIF